MMKRRPLITSVPVLAATFAVGFLTAASADVVDMDNFGLTLNGASVFNDTFGVNQVLAGGTGTVLPSGVNFSNGNSANYSVMGTVTETGNKAVLDTALGAHLVQPPPFFPSANANIVTLLTGPPGSTFSLTPSDTFATTGLFGLTVPATPNGFYQVNLSDRVASNMGQGDVISMQVVNCTPNVQLCGSNTGPIVQLVDGNFLTNTHMAIAQAPLDTSNQEILLELSHPAAGTDTVFGSYAYVNGGIEGPLMPLGSYNDLFLGLNYTQAGFVQLAPVPEPSSLTLLAASIPGALGLVWLRRRKVAGCGSKT